MSGTKVTWLNTPWPVALAANSDVCTSHQLSAGDIFGDINDDNDDNVHDDEDDNDHDNKVDDDNSDKFYLVTTLLPG